MAQKNESGRMIVVDADKLINWLSYAIKELREWNPESEAAAEIEEYLGEINNAKQPVCNMLFTPDDINGDDIQCQCSNCGSLAMFSREDMLDGKGDRSCPKCGYIIDNWQWYRSRADFVGLTFMTRF